MVRLVLVFSLTLLCSCGIVRGKKELKRIKFVEFKCVVLLPEIPVKTIWEEGHGTEYQFWFSDSSVLYINDSEQVSLLNYEKLYEQKDNYFNRQFVTDSIKTSGTDTFEMRWEDHKLNGISIGFTNVSERKLQAFRASLGSVKYSQR